MSDWSGEYLEIVISRSTLEELRLSLAEFNGHRYVDLRLYYRADSGEMRPNRKGITVPPDRWPAFRQALDQLEAQMRERGLLRPSKA